MKTSAAQSSQIPEAVGIPRYPIYMIGFPVIVWGRKEVHNHILNLRGLHWHKNNTYFPVNWRSGYSLPKLFSNKSYNLVRFSFSERSSPSEINCKFKRQSCLVQSASKAINRRRNWHTFSVTPWSKASQESESSDCHGLCHKNSILLSSTVCVRSPWYMVHTGACYIGLGLP